MGPMPLQRKRTKGYRYPADMRVLTVTRGTVYGNPFVIKESKHANGITYFVTRPDAGNMWRFSFDNYSDAARCAVKEFLEYIQDIRNDSPAVYAAIMRDVWDADFIACWCELSAPCHRDVLIELATEWAREHGLTQ